MNLGTKFQLKLTIFIFWAKFTQKRYFWSKREKVNTTIEFCKFELVNILGHNILELHVLIQV